MMTTRDTGLSFHEVGIGEALARWELSVPLNQRSYDWEDEVGQLLNDLFKAFDTGDKIYFLGAIVLTRGLKGELQVSDGQQRLATTSIIVAAVRDFLINAKDPKSAESYQTKYLTNYNPKKAEYEVRLRLNFEDRDYYRETIVNPPDARVPFQGRQFESHKRLENAFKAASLFLRKMTTVDSSDSEKRDRIYEWMEFLHESAKVIAIIIPSSVGNSFKMFETLNARGKDATQIDILKNYIYDKGKEQLETEVHPAWITMKSTIEDIGDDGLLLKYIRHFWISTNGPTTMSELGQRVEENIKTRRQAVDLVKSLDGSAADYAAILGPKNHPRLLDYGFETRQIIFSLTQELGAEQVRPLLLSVLRNFSVIEARKAFQYMLSVSVRFLVVGGGGGGLLDKQYGSRAEDVSNRKIETARQLRDAMAKVVPNDEIFKRSFATISVSKGNIARYYLKSIDVFMQSGEHGAQMLPNEDTTVVNLEHVLPQRPSAEWDIEPDVAAAYFKRLGNMAIISAEDNVKIGNGTFEEKRAAFAGSPFETTRPIAEYQRWGIEEIEERQKTIASLAAEVWPLTWK